MRKDLKEIAYEELSEILQEYLDKGETKQALAYCETIASAGNAYGYMFMGFIYEEGHGSVEADYKKALCCYEKANSLGCDMEVEIVQLKKYLKKFENYKTFL